MWLGSVNLLSPELTIVAAGVSAWQLIESFYDFLNKGGGMKYNSIILSKGVWNLGGSKIHTAYIKGTIIYR